MTIINNTNTGPLNSKHSFHKELVVKAADRAATKLLLDERNITYREVRKEAESRFIIVLFSEADFKAFKPVNVMFAWKSSLEAADRAIRTRNRILRENRTRKLTLRKQLPVPFAGLDREQIARTFLR